MMFFSLLKATFSEDMSLFKVNAGKSASTLKKILLPVVLFLLVCYSIGIYAYEIGKVLAPLNLTYIMISIFLMAVTVIAFMEGIHKSQGILFEAKDNDLLFSLPIKKSHIIFVRIIKLLVFQYMFNLMFLLPAFVIYIYFEHPSISFYLISLIMSFLIPIIPTIISCIIGYIIQMISSKSKKKKLVQVLLTSALLIIFFGLSSNTNNLIESLGKHAETVQDMLTKIYYPIGAYTILINKFDLLVFLKLLLMNIIPLILFILIGQKYYFNIISRLHNNISSSSKKIKTYNNKSSSPLISLTKKELSRYFSSPVYIFNTSFGLILMVVATIILGVKGKTFLTEILSSYGVSKGISLDLLFYGVIMTMLLMTSISSSSISLEGKTISFTKALPIDYKTILQSKILNCFVIESPFTIIAILIFTICFPINPIYLLKLLLLGFISILFMAVTGLLINLRYPKLNFSNETEVVKQSMSSMISVFIGMGLFLISILGMIYFSKWLTTDILLWFHLTILAIITFILYKILMKKGPKKYQELSV